MRRHEDWLKQADSDICAAEKALKALNISKGSESRIHSIKFLLSNLPENITVSDQIQNAARELDKHYIPQDTRTLFRQESQRTFLHRMMHGRR